MEQKQLPVNQIKGQPGLETLLNEAHLSSTAVLNNSNPQSSTATLPAQCDLPAAVQVMNSLPPTFPVKEFSSQSVSQAVNLNLTEGTLSVNLPFINMNQERVRLNNTPSDRVELVSGSVSCGNEGNVSGTKKAFEEASGHPFPKHERRGPSSDDGQVKSHSQFDYSHSVWAKKQKIDGQSSVLNDKEKDLARNCVEFEKISGSGHPHKLSGSQVFADGQSTRNGHVRFDVQDQSAAPSKRSTPRRYKKHDDFSGYGKGKESGKSVLKDKGKGKETAAAAGHKAGFRMVCPDAKELDGDDVDLVKHQQSWVNRKGVQPIDSKQDIGSIHVPLKK